MPEQIPQPIINPEPTQLDTEARNMSAVPDKPDAAADGQDGATAEPSDKGILTQRAREFIAQDVDSLGLLMGVSGISVTVGDGW